MTFNPKFGSAHREIDRTAEMFVGLCRSGHMDRALWLVHDSNRLDLASMKLLCERVDVWAKKGERE